MIQRVAYQRPFSVDARLWRLPERESSNRETVRSPTSATAIRSFGTAIITGHKPATAPSGLCKADTTEDGVRVPFLAKFPTDTLLAEKQNGISNAVATIKYIMPTILDTAGLAHPTPSYRDRGIVTMRGKSLQPFMKSETSRIHPLDFIQGWETRGPAAIRGENYKAIFVPKPKGPEIRDG